jgi:hypothetical protein
VVLMPDVHGAGRVEVCPGLGEGEAAARAPQPEPEEELST